MRHSRLLLTSIAARLNQRANAVRCQRSPELRSQLHREHAGPSSEPKRRARHACFVLISFTCKILHREVPSTVRSTLPISVIVFLLVGALPAQKNPEPRLAIVARLAALTQ